MSRPKVRLPLPRKTERSVPSRGKERREPLMGGEPQFCPDCDAQLEPNGECPNWGTPIDKEEDWL